MMTSTSLPYSGPWYTYREFMMQRYGDVLQRIPIDLGLGCPNRDANGGGGCIYCAEDGARAIQTTGRETIEQQVQAALHFAEKRYEAKRFMLYFQAYTSTFASTEEQKELYEYILTLCHCDAISIGTRPDCLTEETIHYIKTLKEDYDVWVELGIQSMHDTTLTRIHRGHTKQDSITTIQRLHRAGINVMAHSILGLPGETIEDMLETAVQLSRLPISAIKIHNLHILKSAPLAQTYMGQDGDVGLYNEHEYADLVIGFLRRLPPTLPIARLTTDTLNNELVAPKWTMKKGQFLEYLEQQMLMRHVKQGDLYNGNDESLPVSPVCKPVYTEDGSLTFWNQRYKEHYHTPVGARLEAEQKYVYPSKLKNLLNSTDVHLLDICFGLGYNSLCACNQTRGARHQLHVTGLEIDRGAVGMVAAHISTHQDDSFDWSKCLHELCQHAHCHADLFSIHMHWGDARHTIRQLDDVQFDIVYLDAFSTQRNSELWTLDFFKEIYRVIKQNGILLTYCAALPVRSGLIKAGFHVGETEPIARKRSGTIAAKEKCHILQALPEKELDQILHTARGIPYRDPTGSLSNREILRDREREVREYKEKQG